MPKTSKAASPEQNIMVVADPPQLLIPMRISRHEMSLSISWMMRQTSERRCPRCYVLMANACGSSRRNKTSLMVRRDSSAA